MLHVSVMTSATSRVLPLTTISQSTHLPIQDSINDQHPVTTNPPSNTTQALIKVQKGLRN